MVRTVVRLPEDQAATLGRVARRRNMSSAAVIREALAKLLERELAAEEKALKRARAVAGSFTSGIPDLAERHDDYTFEP